MVKIIVENFTEEELRNKCSELARKENWDNECEMCKVPEILYKGTCTRTTEAGEAEFSELWKSWSMFRSKMEPNIKEMNRYRIQIVRN